MWWSSGEQRRQQKEHIKQIIKRTQLSKKSTTTPQQPQQTTTPPSLCHSIPTSAEYYPDSLPQTRAPSVGSPFSGGGYDFTQISPDGYFSMPPPPQPMPPHPQFPMFSPYEIDIKTERQVFVNDVPTRRDSTISTFSTFQPPPAADGMPAHPADSWVQQEYHDSIHETFNEEPVDFNFFQYPHGSISPNHEAVINVDDCDQYLLNHFFDNVLKLIFPILDANQHGSARSDVIIPALESNSAYLHCCLCIAATHMKATRSLDGDQIDKDIVRHRYAAISELCEALGQDTNHAGILEATLGMIFFECSVGRPNDALPDVPWHQHFEAVSNLVQKLDLPGVVLNIAANGPVRPPFNMALTSWIDILGATMLGRAPTFADTYRDLNLSGRTAGLAELMGCDDRIMFLISEVACLDRQKNEGLDEMLLCKYVEVLANEIGQLEDVQPGVATCFSPTGAIRPKQLATNITAVYRCAARIYLCALVPGYFSGQPSTCHLVSKFCELMNYIPAGPDGFDRSLAWPLLLAGANSVAATPFRSMFEERCQSLGDAADFGSFGRVRELLKDVWQMNDSLPAQGEDPGVHWRDVMRQKNWDFLLI
jgi:hypothetical protein